MDRDQRRLRIQHDRSLARAGLGLHLGCVGLQGAGRTPAHREELATLGAGTDGIADVSGSVTGTCICLVDGDDRTLLIDPGVNLLMSQHLRENVSAVLSVLKRRAPGVLISFDPGHVWTTSASEPIAALIALSDVLLVNEREWAGLTEVFGDDGPRVPLVLIKQRTGTWHYDESVFGWSGWISASTSLASIFRADLRPRTPASKAPAGRPR